MNVRAAETAEIDQLATIWYDGWHNAHAHIMPAELTQMRTWESFRDRIRDSLPSIRVAGPIGAPLGFHMLKGDELYQLYVAAQARGAGVAAALIADAEELLAARGTEVAWLACAIGNDRAARFYEKSGWRRAGVTAYTPETTTGILSLEVWRYEKRLTRERAG